MREFTAVILVKEDGSVLSQLRDNNSKILQPNTWATVGGTKEKEDRTLEDAARRELLEETGYVVGELKKLGEDTYTNPRGEEVHRTFYWAPYDGNQSIQCFEGQEIRFLEPEELDILPLFKDHMPFLKAATLLRSRF